MLHLVFQSSIETALFERMATGDEAVFLENAVYRVLIKSHISGLLTQQLSRSRFYVLSDDLKTRGLAPADLIKGIHVIDYSELVELTLQNQVIQSWCQ
ncbi:MAG: sulfurtransferase complex subunit TusB [Methylococcaceae bacterium]|nr:sulfurtransferase complex subunit TusB [Methylococcaceae bacterium]